MLKFYAKKISPWFTVLMFALTAIFGLLSMALLLPVGGGFSFEALFAFLLMNTVIAASFIAAAKAGKGTCSRSPAAPTLLILLLLSAFLFGAWHLDFLGVEGSAIAIIAFVLYLLSGIAALLLLVFLLLGRKFPKIEERNQVAVPVLALVLLGLHLLASFVAFLTPIVMVFGANGSAMGAFVFTHHVFRAFYHMCFAILATHVVLVGMADKFPAAETKEPAPATEAAKAETEKKAETEEPAVETPTAEAPAPEPEKVPEEPAEPKKE